MPIHYEKKDKPKVSNTKKEINNKMPKPLNKPRKQLSKLQKEYMKKHSKEHSEEHNKEMIKLMKKGYCIEQSHKLAMKNVGK